MTAFTLFFFNQITPRLFSFFSCVKTANAVGPPNKAPPSMKDDMKIHTPSPFFSLIKSKDFFRSYSTTPSSAETFDQIFFPLLPFFLK